MSQSDPKQPESSPNTSLANAPALGDGFRASPPTASERVPPAVLTGVCRVMFAFDAAIAIDLDLAASLVGADDGGGRTNIRVTRRAPASLGYQSTPLRMTLPAPQINLGDWMNQPTCEALAFDFGGISICFQIPFSGTIDSLIPLGQRLYDNADFQSAAREAVEKVSRLIARAMSRASIDPAVEDYIVYHAPRHNGPIEPSIWSALRQDRASIARLLRAELAPVSEQETDEALANVSTYTPADVAVIDWNAALVVDPDGDDVVSILEYANMELLEMRTLDNRLDRALDEAYAFAVYQEDRTMPSWRSTGRIASNRRNGMKQVARLQVDSAVLFEGVNNAIKLVGDQYLARVYRLAARRFHLPERDTGIERKLSTLNGIYGKLSDESAARRMEILEWIIIVLITVSIILPFVTPLAK